MILLNFLSSNNPTDSKNTNKILALTDTIQISVQSIENQVKIIQIKLFPIALLKYSRYLLLTKTGQHFKLYLKQ